MLQVVDDDKGRKTTIIYMKRKLIEAISKMSSRKFVFSDIIERAVELYLKTNYKQFRNTKTGEVWDAIVQLPGPCGGKYTILESRKLKIISDLDDCIGGLDDDREWEEVKHE